MLKKTNPDKLAIKPGNRSRGNIVENSVLILLHYEQQLAAWVTTSSSTRALQINGQPHVFIKNKNSFISAIEDIQERLRGDGNHVIATHFLTDAQGRELACDNNITPYLSQSNDSLWQIISWEWLANRFGIQNDSPWKLIEVLQAELFPWLLTAEHSHDRKAMQEILAREHQDESERLQAERQLILDENDRLRTQNIALQQVETEKLVTFLPALFSRVFTVLGAADLALLCGKIEPLAIPTPYPEPSEETLRVLQKNFRALSPKLQLQIVNLVVHLPQRQKLMVRSEMRDLVSELETGR